MIEVGSYIAFSFYFQNTKEYDKLFEYLDANERMYYVSDCSRTGSRRYIFVETDLEYKDCLLDKVKEINNEEE